MAVLAPKAGSTLWGRASRLPNRLSSLVIESDSNSPVATDRASGSRGGGGSLVIILLLPRKHAPQSPRAARAWPTDAGSQGEAAQAVHQQIFITLHTKRRSGRSGGQRWGIRSRARGPIVLLLLLLLLKTGSIGLQCGREARGRRHGGWSVGAQVRKGLCSPQILRIPETSRRVKDAKESRILAAKRTKGTGTVASCLAKVNGGSAVQATTCCVCRVYRCRH